MKSRVSKNQAYESIASLVSKEGYSSVIKGLKAGKIKYLSALDISVRQYNDRVRYVNKKSGIKKEQKIKSSEVLKKLKFNLIQGPSETDILKGLEGLRSNRVKKQSKTLIGSSESNKEIQKIMAHTTPKLATQAESVYKEYVKALNKAKKIKNVGLNLDLKENLKNLDYSIPKIKEETYIINEIAKKGNVTQAYQSIAQETTEFLNKRELKRLKERLKIAYKGNDEAIKAIEEAKTLEDLKPFENQLIALSKAYKDFVFGGLKSKEVPEELTKEKLSSLLWKKERKTEQYIENFLNGLNTAKRNRIIHNSDFKDIIKIIDLLPLESLRDIITDDRLNMDVWYPEESQGWVVDRGEDLYYNLQQVIREHILDFDYDTQKKLNKYL